MGYGRICRAKSTLRYDGPGTFTAGSQAAMTGAGFPQFAATPAEAFADDFSWGYQVLGRSRLQQPFPEREHAADHRIHA